jgi:hypothetical protein
MKSFDNSRFACIVSANYDGALSQGDFVLFETTEIV